MRILHVCKYFFPKITGVTAYVDNLGHRQQAMGHTVAVATWGETAGIARHGDLAVLRARTGDGPGLVGLMRDFRPDVIHAHSIWETTTLAVAAARAEGCPYVVTTHGTWHFLRHTDAYARWQDRLRLGIWRKRVVWPRLLRGAGGVIALNAQEEASARRDGVAGDRLWRIPNAVDPELFYPGDAEAAKTAWGWRQGFTVLFVGSVQAQKGVFTLLAAAAAMEPASRPRFVFCGHGPQLAQARETAEAHGLVDAAAFLGVVPRDRMPSLYRAADVLALPSRDEPFATVLLEAMASGLPCLGADSGGTPEIIQHGRTGLLSPPDEARVLARQIAQLSTCPDTARKMGRAGRLRVEAHFSWSGVAQHIETVYRRALGLAVLLWWLIAACSPLQAATLTPLPMLSLEPPDTPQVMDDPFYDGRTIRLSLAAGETAGCQLLLHPDPGQSPDAITMEVRTDPADHNGLTVRLYRVWSIWGVPEVAVPMEQASPRPFPVVGRPEQATTDQSWRGVVEIEAPRGAGSGITHSEIVVSWPGGQALLPLEIAILPFALPPRPGFVLEMNSYGDYLRLLPTGPEMLLTLHRLFHRFRATFTLIPYRQDGSALMGCLAPVLTADGLDFTAFDLALAGLFDGSAFPDGQPVAHWILPFREGWPAPLATDAAQARERHITARRAMAEHIREKNWTGTVFQEFHNENPEHGSKAPWFLDEPRSNADLDGHARFLDALGQACASTAGPCPIVYRIDISRWQPLAPGLHRLGKAVSVWSVSVDPDYLDQNTVAFFRGLGALRLMAYGELPGFSAHGQPTPWTAQMDRLAALSLAGLDGFAQWQADRWQDKAIPDVATEAVPLVYANAAGARDFIWPGLAFGLDAPVPSMRLFALREGQNILDYLTLAIARRPEAAPDLRQRLAGLIGRPARDWLAFKALLARHATGEPRL